MLHFLHLVIETAEQNLDGCAEYLQSTKTKGSKYEWFTYADASHGWDKKGESHLGYIFDPGRFQ